MAGEIVDVNGIAIDPDGEFGEWGECGSCAPEVSADNADNSLEMFLVLAWFDDVC